MCLFTVKQLASTCLAVVFPKMASRGSRKSDDKTETHNLFIFVINTTCEQRLYYKKSQMLKWRISILTGTVGEVNEKSGFNYRKQKY